MPLLSYGIGAFDRDTGNLPELKCVNLYAESARTSEGQICLQSRPGLAMVAINGSGPVRQLYCELDVLSSDYFSVIGSSVSPTLYRATSSLGTLTNVTAGANTAIVIAGSTSEILIAGAGT